MNRIPDITIRLVVRPPKGDGRELALSSPADVPARVAGAAITAALGLDAGGYQAVRLSTGDPFGDAPLSALRLCQGDEIMLRESLGAGAVSPNMLVDLTIQEPERPARTVSLPIGDHLIGRQAQSVTVQLHDSTVSGVHARIGISGAGVTVTDQRSTNRTHLNGQRLEPLVVTPLILPAALLMGKTTLTIAPRPDPNGQRTAAQAASATRPMEPVNMNGDIPFNLPPRVIRPLPKETLTVAAPPADPQKGRIPIATSVVPLVLTASLFLLAPNSPPTFLLFALMSPAIAVASFWEDRRHGSGAFKDQSAKFRTSVESAIRRAIDLRGGEADRRVSDSPAPNTLADWVRRRASRLWERRLDEDDFLRLRVGVGTDPSLIGIDIAGGGNEELRTWARQRVDANSTLLNVPITLDLATIGSVGIVGPKQHVESLARWLAVQAASLHSPRDLSIAAIASDQGAASWEWLKWFPHVRPENSPLRGRSLAGPSRLTVLVSDLRRLQADRSAPKYGAALQSRQSKRPWVLLLVDGTAPVDRAAIAPVLSSAVEAGVATIWIAGRIQDIPGDCRSVIEIAPDGSASLTDRSGQSHSGIAPDGLTVDAAREVAMSMAPISDVSAEQTSGGLPSDVGLLEALDVSGNSVEAWLRTAWHGRRDAIGVPIGALADGPLVLDIERDGPHGLVAGTTGAGKSELLQTLVGALAACHPPSRVTFLLIDYKGGTAFRECRDLPHTVGYVTDLSPSLTARALTSLNAEIRRREHILGSSEAKDLKGLRRIDPTAPPSLLIVVDEYATLLKELPDFVSGLVDVAQRGRALGVHLVLGTQSPGGTVAQAIQANIGFRIALRTANAEESSAVIGSDVASTISPDIPGRAYVRLPSGELRLFQAAYANARRTSDATASVTVDEFGFLGGGAGRKKEEGSDGITDLGLIAEAARSAFTASGEVEPHRPWLPPLPGLIKASDLAADGLLVPLGLVDEAEQQRQVTATLDLEACGGLIVYGTASSGKTSTLRAAAVGLADRMGPADLHLYGLDFGAGALRVLEALPQCGAIIQGDDLERAVRLLRLVRHEIELRKATLSQAGLSFAAAARSEDPALALPRIVIVLDGYEGFTTAFERVAFGEWVDALPRMVVDGRAVGIHFLVSAARRFSVPSPVVGTLERRLVLRQAEPDDYLQLGLHVNPKQIPELPPGRGFTETTSLIQCAVVGGAQEAEQAAEIRNVGASVRERFAAADVPTVGRLSTSVSLASLPPRLESGAFVIGVGDTALAPVGMRPEDGHVLVAGPGRSGRTTALVSLADSIWRSG
jgi:S-DNA-T family DNA segregation ATPase FtsK/SpoIIIE